MQLVGVAPMVFGYRAMNPVDDPRHMPQPLMCPRGTH
jgi:hypothetical protein